MYIDAVTIQWVMIAAASGCAFMAGKAWGTGTRDQVIEDTIVYLIENNFVRSKKVDDEIELIPLDKE